MILRIGAFILSRNDNGGKTNGLLQSIRNFQGSRGSNELNLFFSGRYKYYHSEEEVKKLGIDYIKNEGGISVKNRVFYAVISFILMGGIIAQQAELPAKSNSQKWDSGTSREILSEYETKYQCSFEAADKEVEEKLYGIWQVKELVGWTSSNEISFDGGIGGIVIFCEEAWIDDGTPWFKPVYYCHRADVEELSGEDFLNISWSDDRYSGQEGIYIIATYSEENRVMEDKYLKPRLRLIIFGDTLVMEMNESYFELEKIADIHMNDKFTNVEKPEN